jgi:NAD+ synthase (glutamine-hydrolysing)
MNSLFLAFCVKWIASAPGPHIYDFLGQWKNRPGYGPREIAEKVMRFFRFYAINRHKATIITPSSHLSTYNPDDNRHDLRPFLYVVNWPWQFGKIMAHVEELEKKIERQEK